MKINGNKVSQAFQNDLRKARSNRLYKFVVRSITKSGSISKIHVNDQFNAFYDLESAFERVRGSKVLNPHIEFVVCHYGTYSAVSHKEAAIEQKQLKEVKPMEEKQEVKSANKGQSKLKLAWSLVKSGKAADLKSAMAKIQANPSEYGF